VLDYIGVTGIAEKLASTKPPLMSCAEQLAVLKLESDVSEAYMMDRL